MYDFAKEMYFDEKCSVNKSVRGRSLKGLLKSPAIIIFASSDLSSRKEKSFSKGIICHLILMNDVIEKNYYYKNNKLEKILT